MSSKHGTRPSEKEDPSDGAQLSVLIPPKGSFTSKVSQGRINLTLGLARKEGEGGFAKPGAGGFYTTIENN